MIFSKQFATMVKAGWPILNVLKMLRDQLEHPEMKIIVEDIRSNLEGGVTLSKCFDKYPKVFDNIYVNLKTKKTLIPSKTQPTEEDYERGYMSRYFVQKVNYLNLHQKMDY